MTRKTVLSLSAVLLLIIVFMIGPIVFSSETLAPFCPMAKVNAQDNPCLAEAATLSAVQLQLQQVSFQATLDTINFQSTLVASKNSTGLDYVSTITALEGQVKTLQASNQIPTAIPAVGLPFEENFSTNQRGWILTRNNYGVARLSHGTLAIEVSGESIYWQPIPGLEVNDNFYIEATVNPNGWWSYRLAGFALGSEDTNQYHIFALGCVGHCDPYVGFYDNQTPLFLTSYNFPQISNNGVRVGLEAHDGLYTLYIDGQPSESAQISPHGNQLGLAVIGTRGGSKDPVLFDNIVVRETR